MRRRGGRRPPAKATRLAAALAAVALVLSCASDAPARSTAAPPQGKPSATSAAPTVPLPEPAPAPSPSPDAQAAPDAQTTPVEKTAPARPEKLKPVATKPALKRPESPVSVAVRPPEPSTYLSTALSQYSSRELPNGIVLSVKRQPGRTAAAARIALVPGSYPERQAGLPALALACAAKGPSGSRQGSVDSALYDAGASLELRIDDYDDVALELVCPVASLIPALDFVVRSLVAPAFLQEDFDRVLVDFKIAERRESGDPVLRAASQLRSLAYRGHPYAVPPRGTAASLAALDRDDVLRFWADGAGAERLRISVVGDVDPDELARRLSPDLGALPRRGPSPARPNALPLQSLVSAEPFPASPGRAIVRAEFGAPEVDSPDFAALSVALSMLDDLLALRLAVASPPLAYAAWTRLSFAAAGSASLVIQDCPDPLAAKAAFEVAARELAAGRCLDSNSRGALGDIEGSIGSYRLRAVAKTYAKADGSADLAARIARDLAAGRDGAAFFRMADRIAAVSAADVARVARERLVEGPAAWIALGDPRIIAGFATTRN